MARRFAARPLLVNKKALDEPRLQALGCQAEWKKVMNSRDRAYSLCEAGEFTRALELFRTLEDQSTDLLEKAGYAADEATCYHEIGNQDEANICIARAKDFAQGDRLSSAQIEYLAAKFLLEENKTDPGLQALARIPEKYASELKSSEGFELYKRIQLERAFTLMHLSRRAEARPLLEEALSFGLTNETGSDLHCHLGRCYSELSCYELAREQFLLAEKLGISEEWKSAFHYYLGYVLFELNDFQAANRHFIVCLQKGQPGPPESLVYRMLAETSRKLGDTDRAMLYDQKSRSS